MRPLRTMVGSLMVMAVATGPLRAQENPYEVERSWPDEFMELYNSVVEDQGTYKAGPHPVWTVHVPDGWLGNCIFIEGNDGVIVYDTGISLEAGAFCAEEVRKITNKSIKVVFYSHHHGDHYGGTASLVSAEDVAAGKVKIYAWENFEREREDESFLIAFRQIMGVFYYGPDLLPPEEKHHHAGAGLRLLGGSSSYIPPTDLLGEDTELEVAGVRMTAFYTGGEAISEFGLYLPDFDMVIIADEMFYSQPNVHSIRGSKPRNPENYLRAIDRVRALQPEWLLGSHIMPIRGREKIYEITTRYRDAIQYLWDQSIRYINKGYTKAELQHQLKSIPEFSEAPPFTRPHYGAPYMTVPEYHGGWVSWFSGDATDLFPTEPVEKARRLVALMGGRDRVMAEARKVFRNGDAQFAAELTQLVVRIDHADTDARMLKAASLKSLGYAEMNSIARAWYLNGAQELEGKIDPRAILTAALEQRAAAKQPASQIFVRWRYQVDAERAQNTRIRLGFEMTDTGQTLGLELRRSILDLDPDGVPDSPDSLVRLSTETLNRINRGETTFATAVGTGDVEIRGSATAPDRLLGYLDREIPAIYMHVR